MRELDEEIVNAWTHLVSCVLCFLVFTYVIFSSHITLQNKVSFLPMIGTSIWTFFSSYLYHIEKDNIIKERNRKLDKTAIYLMILGCGITTCLTCENQKIALYFSIGIIVIIASMAIGFCTSRKFPDWLSVTSYIIAGWLSVLPALGIFSDSLYTKCNTTYLVLISGAFYCIGVIFYTRDSIKWNHTIWHLFVMLGAGFHIFAQIKSISV